MHIRNVHTSATLHRRSMQSTSFLHRKPRSILGSIAKSGILRTRSQRNVHQSSATLYTVAYRVCACSKLVSLVAVDCSDPASLAPIESHRACAPPDNELLVDNIFNRGDSHLKQRNVSEVSIRQTTPEQGSVSPLGHNLTPISPASCRTGSTTFLYRSTAS